MSNSNYQRYLLELEMMPEKVTEALKSNDVAKEIASIYKDSSNCLYLGRGYNFPVALEGALKLKEISYIHAEAYPAGELKHGPLALVDAEMPVVVVAPNDELLEKLKANMQEVSARGGQLYVFADGDSTLTPSDGVNVLVMPEPVSYTHLTLPTSDLV